MILKKIITFYMMVCTTGAITAQDNILPLWLKQIPNQIKSDEKEVKEYTDILRISMVQEPTIEVYLPSKGNSNGQAVLIFPGGGYQILAYDWEGTDMAKFLNSKGIAGIVVKYRLPNSKSLKEQYNVPLQDAQRAIRLVRANAETWHIQPDKIGIMGFSAGGHLAATLGTHFNEEVHTPQDDIDSLSARPDFMALIYPVITLQNPYTHQGSKKALLRENPSDEMIKHFSNELQVKEDTPPTFLVHATDDTAVPVENSLLFYEALKAKKVSVTLFIYPNGGHGFSFGFKDAFLKDWTNQLSNWLNSMN
tara:strand:- start:4607 stop:5527 length:921 start_codon:yes stop_codon:yes gene_type:complete